MTSQEPKKRGRPKKVVEAQKEINPDCKPATRGYVKCLLRKTRNHTHRNHVDGCVIGLSAIVGWLATVAIFMITHGTKYNDGTPVTFPEAWFVGMINNKMLKYKKVFRETFSLFSNNPV